MMKHILEKKGISLPYIKNEPVKGSEWDGGKNLRIEIFVLQHFFSTKKMGKKVQISLQ